MADAASEQAVALSTGIVSALQVAGVLQSQNGPALIEKRVVSTPPVPSKEPKVGMSTTLWSASYGR